MEFFDKVLSSIGIGCAKVDTQISNETVRVGDKINGVVHIQGGNVEQQIDRIYLNLMTEYIREVEDRKVRETAVIQKFSLAEPFVIKAKEVKQIPFSIPLPLQTPVSLKRKSVWLQTSLDISKAVDPSDQDYLEILPHPYMQTVLDAVIQDLGFGVLKAANKRDSRMNRHVPFVQEFEFYPKKQFRGQLDELEMVFFLQEDGIEFFMEIDRKGRGVTGFLSEALDMDERKVHIVFTQEQLRRGSAYIADYLQDIIERYI